MGTLSKFQVVSGAPTAPMYINQRVLAADTAETETPPSGAKSVLINATADVWVRWDGSAAAIAAVDVTDGSGVELNPLFRALEGVTTISVIAGATATVTLAYYS